MKAVFASADVFAQRLSEQQLDMTKVLTLTGHVMRVSGAPLDKHAGIVLVTANPTKEVWVVLGDAPPSYDAKAGVRARRTDRAR